jgi:hypothetical protein
MYYFCSDITLPGVGTIPGEDRTGVRDAVKCRDGTTLSVQASFTHYCTPRNNEGPYTHVEVWCVYATCEPRADYFMEDGDDDGPWGQVPVGKVAEFIAAHGGLE